MLGKFQPKTGLEVLPLRDKNLIGIEFEWTVIGKFEPNSDEYPNQAMMAPPPSAGFSFGWTPEEDIEVT